MHGFSYLATRAYWPLRWFAHEFLRISIRLDASSILTSLCRLFGVAIILAIVRFTLSGGLAPASVAALLQCGLAALLAVLIGNIAKEMAIELCAGAMRLCGRDFSRIGATLDGGTYRETLHVDGTWIRCVSRPAGSVCEWTDRWGACYQIVTGPRNSVLRRRRSAP